MIREGQEDYEYFKLLADAGDAAMADREAATLAPHAYQNAADPAAIDASRRRMALRIEQLTGQTPPPIGGGAGGPTGGGGAGSGDSSNTGGNGAVAASSPDSAVPHSGGGHAGCSAAAGRAPLVTPFSLALAAAVLFLAARRRRVRRLRRAQAG